MFTTYSNIAVTALVFLLGLVLGGIAFWWFGRRHTHTETLTAEKPEAKSETKSAVNLSFRLGYIALPGAVALTTIVFLAILYPSFPNELAYRFSSSGAPQSYIGRELFAVLMIVAQLVVVGFAAAAALFILRLARRMLKDSPAPIAPGRIIWLMANMLVLPQILIAFVALDAAYYANKTAHIMTPWLFSLLAIGVGTLVIIILFALSLNEARRAK